MSKFLGFSTMALGIGVLLDCLLGDPKGWPHLIRLFGNVIKALEGRLYPLTNKGFAGAVLVAITLLICGGLPALLLVVAWRTSCFLYLALESLLCWQLLAVRSLRDESLPVYQSLKRRDLPEARKALSMIVGRDTAHLDEAGIIKATVETVAENTADGVAAPLLYMALGGAMLGCIYKAVNTMDSMIGYKNERYQAFGRCAARVDDVLGYLPARICALTMIVSSWLCGFSANDAFRIWRRDKRQHASPNSAQTEAAIAGALQVQLAGNAVYQGIVHQKPTIGDDIRPIVSKDILRSHRMLFVTSGLLLLISLMIRGVWYAVL